MISRTVPVSVYKTVNELIQQHTAVRYNSWLRRTAMNLLLQHSATHFYSSKVRRPSRSHGLFVCRDLFLRTFSWVCWRCLRKRRIWFLSRWGKLISSYWQNDKRILQMLKLKWHIQYYITQAVSPISFTSPSIFNFHYLPISVTVQTLHLTVHNIQRIAQ